MEKMTRKERILYALKQVGVEKITDFGEPHGSAQYSQIYRQLYTDKYNPTIELVEYICNKYPQISSDYLVNGSGPWERTKIVTPPAQHHQDIHIEGGTAAISQSGSATVDAPQVGHTSEPDIATMIRKNDLGGLVSIIMQQKDEIIRLKEQRIRDLETSIRIADNQLFPEPK